MYNSFYFFGKFWFFKNLLFIYLFWLCQVLVAACVIFSCSMWTQLWHVGSQLKYADFLVVACELLVAACMQDLVSRPGIDHGPPAFGAQSLTHWPTREVPRVMFYLVEIFRTSSLRGSISSNPERTVPRREPGYIGVLQQRAGSLNVKDYC